MRKLLALSFLLCLASASPTSASPMPDCNAPVSPREVVKVGTDLAISLLIDANQEEEKLQVENTIEENDSDGLKWVSFRVIIPSEVRMGAGGRWYRFTLSLSLPTSKAELLVKIEGLKYVRAGHFNDPSFSSYMTVPPDAEVQVIIKDLENRFFEAWEKLDGDKGDDAQQLIDAIKSHDAGDLENLLVMKCLDPNTLAQDGQSPLGFAAQTLKLAAVIDLLENGADPNFPQLSAGKKEAPLQALLGYDVFVEPRNGMTSCEQTTLVRREIAAALIVSKANVEGEIGDGEPRPLYAAATFIFPCSPVDILDVLASAIPGPDVNAGRVSVAINTPLSGAIGYGTVEAVRWLLDNGANTEAVSGVLGGTAVFELALRGQNNIYGDYECNGNSDNDLTWIFRLLIDNGANLNAKDTNGLTALDEIKRWRPGDISEDCFDRLKKHALPVNLRPNLFFCRRNTIFSDCLETGPVPSTW